MGIHIVLDRTLFREKGNTIGICKVYIATYWEVLKNLVEKLGIGNPSKVLTEKKRSKRKM